MIKKYILIVFGLLVAPSLAHATVRINEVAWMGTSESQYGEWIELYNDGDSDVNLSGWKLFESGGGTTIFTLTKSISANGYLVIERTTPSTPDPLPSINDETLSFGGSGFSNTGEYLVLKSDTGAIIDSLDASSGWPAGDATTKETMQKSGSTWATSLGTPGEQNGGSTPNTSSSALVTSNDSDDEIVETPDPVLYVTLSGPSVLAANMVGTFTPKAGYTDGSVLAVGKFFWNFGDGETLTQRTSEPVRHTYTRPGKYVVVLEYSKNYSSEVSDMTTKFIVTVPTIPIIFSVTKSTVSIKNIGSGEIDISNFIIQSQKNTLIIPRGTLLLPGSDIVFPADPFGGTSEKISLLYPNGTLFAVGTTTALKTISRAVIATQKSPVPKEAALVSEDALLANVVSSQMTNESDTANEGQSSKILFALFGLILLVAAAVILFLKLRKNRVPSPQAVTANDIKIIESEE